MSHLSENLKRYFKTQSDIVSTTEYLSISDGALWAIYSAMTGTYIVPLSIYLFGNNAPVGLITGLPYILLPAAQYFSGNYSEKTGSIKKLTVITTLLDRILWIPPVLLLFFPSQIRMISIFIVLLSIRFFFGSFSGTTWTLWIPSIVPASHRNTYFSKRNAIMKFFSLAGYLFSSLIFLYIKDEKIALFTTYLIGVVIFSSASIALMMKIPDHKLEKSSMTAQSEHSRYGTFLIFVILLSTGLSGFYPFYQLQILSDHFLGVSVFQYTIIIIIISLSFIVSQLIFGKISKRIPIERTAALSILIFIIGLIAILIFANYYVVIFTGILYGISQSGTSLTVFNMMLARIGNKKTKNVSLYNLFSTSGSVGGPLISQILFYSTGLNSVYIFAILVCAVSAFILMIENRSLTP
ncbi:MFS transporter [Caldiplasma sukawensis]